MVKLKNAHEAQRLEMEDKQRVLQKNQRELDALSETLRQVMTP